jgi:hypothetical protein
VAMYAKTKDTPGEKGSTSTPNAVTHSAHQSIAQLPSSDTVGGLEQGEWWHGQYR